MAATYTLPMELLPQPNCLGRQKVERKRRWGCGHRVADAFSMTLPSSGSLIRFNPRPASSSPRVSSLASRILIKRRTYYPILAFHNKSWQMRLPIGGIMQLKHCLCGEIVCRLFVSWQYCVAWDGSQYIPCSAAGANTAFQYPGAHLISYPFVCTVNTKLFLRLLYITSPRNFYLFFFIKYNLP